MQPNIPNSRHHLHHSSPVSNYFPTDANQRKQEVEVICLDLLRRFQQACRYEWLIHSHFLLYSNVLIKAHIFVIQANKNNISLF